MLVLKISRFGGWWTSTRRTLRSLGCVLSEGGHFYLVERRPERVLMVCQWCGAQTPGWDVTTTTPRPRSGDDDWRNTARVVRRKRVG